jgi:transposase-like protein
MQGAAGSQAGLSEEACLDKIMELRFGGAHLECPSCARRGRFDRNVKLRAYACPACGYALYPCHGTPFESRHIPLTQWFLAIALGAAGKVSVKDLQQTLGCSKESAGRIRQQLHELATAPKGATPYSGWSKKIASYVRAATGTPERPSAATRPATVPPGVVRVAAAGSRPPPAPRPSRSWALPLAAGGAGVAGLAVAAFLAFSGGDPGIAPEDGASAGRPTVPELTLAGPKPTLVLSAVNEDLEAAKAAVAYGVSHPPSIQLGPGAAPEAPGPAPATPLPGPALEPGGDPNTLLTFGPIRIRRHLVDTIVRASKVVGADPTLMMAIADKESSFATEVKAKTSSATGLYQFIEKTWLGVVDEFGEKHGLAREANAIVRTAGSFTVADAAERARILDLRREPYLSALLAGEMLKRDTLRIQARVGRALSAGEIYLIHFLGPGAAEEFIEQVGEEPDSNASDRLRKPAEANQSIFYKNGRPLTAAEMHRNFEKMMSDRLGRYQAVKTLGATAAVGTGVPR